MLFRSHVHANNAFAANVQEDNFLVQGSDWSDASAGLERGTLMSIRGWISASMDASPSAVDTLFLAIGVFHEDAAFPAINQESAYIEDVLWTGGFQATNPATAAGDIRRNWVWEVNVKARRRITDQQVVMFSLIGTEAGDFSCVLRSLIRRD